MSPGFALFLFAVEPGLVAEATEAGVDGFVVDWERYGKEHRQAGADTAISDHTLGDLRRVRAHTRARILCRVNNGPTTPDEVSQAVDGGADEILLPMVRSPREVESVLRLTDGRAEVGILVETVAALEHLPELGALSLSRVFVGLNDLAIERRTPSIFASLLDGTVEWVRAHFQTPFGFGGLTRPERGDPVPCRLLMAEMARLGCSFGLLRRSFLRDVPRGELGAQLPRLRAALADAAARSAGEVYRDRLELGRRLAALRTADASACPA
jgi:hypothetical protein